MEIHIHIHHHRDEQLARVSDQVSDLTTIVTKGFKHMATKQDLKDVAAEIDANATAMQEAVDAAEKRLTDAIASGQVLTQADLDEVFGTLRGAADKQKSAVDDLNDGVDEAAGATAKKT